MKLLTRRRSRRPTEVTLEPALAREPTMGDLWDRRLGESARRRAELDAAALVSAGGRVPSSVIGGAEGPTMFGGLRGRLSDIAIRAIGRTPEDLVDDAD